MAGNLAGRLKMKGKEQVLTAYLFTDDSASLAEDEGMLQRIVNEYERMCIWRKLKMIVGKRKVMVIESMRANH